MNEIRSEIMGTMARNTQRNKSTLNVLAKQKADAEKLKRLPPRPLNPNKCSDLGHAIQYRHNVRRDIAHMAAGISKMRLEKPRALLPPSDDDPEPFEYSPEDIAAAQRYFDSQIEEVRQRNAEINAHTRLYDQWDRRVVALGGDSERREAPENVINGVAYFGAARYLPEYTDKMAARLASATSATRGIGQKTGRSTESDVLLSEEGKKSGDVDAAYADSEDDMLESTKDADDEDYAAFLAGGGDFGVVGGGVEKSLAPLLCLGASCNGLPSLPSHVAPHSPEAILLQLSGQVRIGPLNSGVCKGCGGNAATRDLWKSEMAKMDARAAELQPKPQENNTVPYDLAELLAIEPFTADTYAAFVLAEKKKELRDRMASARRNATPGAAS